MKNPRTPAQLIVESEKAKSRAEQLTKWANINGDKAHNQRLAAKKLLSRSAKLLARASTAAAEATPPAPEPSPPTAEALIENAVRSEEAPAPLPDPTVVAGATA